MKGNVQPSVVTIGTFDGVHRGHRALISRVLELSAKQRCRSIVVTLERPVRPVHGLLTTLEEKLALLGSFPFDDIIVLPYHTDVTDQPAEVFLDKFICGTLNARILVVGENFAFGKGRQGSVSWLREQAPSRDLSLELVPPVFFRNKIISSTWIRELLHKGSILEAHRLLGALFSIEGEQVGGRRIGRTLGFPTINIAVDPQKLLPLGVYTALVPAAAGKKTVLREAMVNIGTRPTFTSAHALHVEIHLLGFQGRWKQKYTRAYLCTRLRNEMKFSSPAALLLQLKKDKTATEQYFSGGHRG